MNENDNPECQGFLNYFYVSFLKNSLHKKEKMPGAISL